MRLSLVRTPSPMHDSGKNNVLKSMTKSKANLRNLGANNEEVQEMKMSIVQQGILQIEESSGEILIKLTKQ